MKPFAIRVAAVATLLLMPPAYADAAPAADTTASGDTLPTVIVTAEKSGRSVMDTPTSAAVLDARDLDARGLQSAKDVLANAANITFVGTGNIAPAIRGVDSTGASQGSDAFIAGSRPRLNIQIDGRPLSYNEIIFADSELWDVQQVEVLRGAQSTLQGRNAMAGTIATETNDPTFQNEGALRVGGGNDEQSRFSGLFNTPLGDSVALRLAADYQQHISWVDGYEPYPTVDDPRQFKSLDLRGKLLFAPSSMPAWRTVVTLNHADYEGPQTEDVDREGGRPFSARRSSYLYEPMFEPKSSSAIVDTSYDISDGLRFEGLATGTGLHVDRRANVGDGVATVDGRQYTLEPRLRFGGDDRFSGVLGLFMFASDQDETLDYAAFQRYDDQIRTAAVFGEATIPFGASPFDLIAGGRYEREKHQRHGGAHEDGVDVDVALDKTYDAFLPRLGMAWHVDAKTTLGFVASRGYNGGGAGASISYHQTDPGDPGSPWVLDISNYNYDPEYVWTYELYGRQTLLDDHLRLTANVFYADYSDYQLMFDLTPDEPADYSFIVDNARKVKTYGAELGATWLIKRGLEVFANLGTLNTEISRYPDSGYQGHQLANAPKLNGSAGINWQGHGWDTGFNARYSSAYYSDVANQPRAQVQPYWLVNAQLGYTCQATRIYGSVRNVFDSDKPLALYPGATPDDDGASLPAPRTYWIGLEMRW
ncbi:TonB-dependent receptor [Solimonas soli]|uniref:TonB-dependent receptor n=1 Tax=Solimonas soli TaxID=413479 RepID=UPI000489FDD2|nr:TonB-dependent receptor plug domain-containing protein [Solimonas soli]